MTFLCPKITPALAENMYIQKSSVTSFHEISILRRITTVSQS